MILAQTYPSVTCVNAGFLQTVTEILISCQDTRGRVVSMSTNLNQIHMKTRKHGELFNEDIRCGHIQ